MSLRMILGNSGSGKSRHIMEEILSRAMAEPDQLFYVVVPEQFTMQTQRTFVEHHPGNCIMNIDVVSFERLVYRIFDELGISDFLVLEETGKSLVLRRLAGQKEKELEILRGNIHRMGYIGEIKSMISEFSQYNISAKHLREILDRLDENSNLARKIRDILKLYEAFDAYLEKGCITAERLLDILAGRAGDSALLRGCVMAFDGFTGFTPVQMNLMRVLMHLVSDMYVTVTIDEEADPSLDLGMQDLFFMSKKMIRGLTKLANETQFPIAEPQIISMQSVKYRKDHSNDRVSELAFLEQNLFRRKAGTFRGGIENGAVRLLTLPNPREELNFVAEQIRELVMSGAYRYRDIAIVSGSIETYETYVPSIFQKLHIPYFLDRKKSLLYHPMIEWVRAVMEMLEQDFSYESVFRYLRSGLGGFSREDVDLLENHVLAYGIRGKNKWGEVWAFHENGQQKPGKEVSQEKGEEAQENKWQHLNELRSQFMAQMESVTVVFEDKESTVRQRTKALYDLMVQLDMQRQMMDWQDFFEKQGDLTAAKEYAQIYEYVIDLFDQIVELLGDEQIPVCEYSELLDAGFSAAQIGVIPPGNDYVLLGDTLRTRLNHVKVMFVIGVNDGIIPKRTDRGSILSPYEREKLAELDVELAPTEREQAFMQKFYLYLNLTKASKKLYLTWSKLDSAGNALRPSYLAGVIQGFFTQIQIEEPKGGNICTPEQSMYIYVDGLKRAGMGEADASWVALHSWYQQQKGYNEEIQKLFSRAFDVLEGEYLSGQTARYLYGKILENSVTRLEQFARCAFSHFLKYGLRLEERKIFEVGAVDLGSVFHDALDYYAKLLEQKGCTWTDISEEIREQLVEQAMEAAILGLGKSAFFDNARNAYVLERVRRILRRSVWALTEQIRRGHFKPEGYEVFFSREEILDSKHMALSDGERMYLKGRIDRIDLYQEDNKIYVKIIDYKSGNMTFQLLNLYHGLQLQLVVYLGAAMKKLAEKYPDKKLIPAGIFYYHIDDPVVEDEPGKSEEEIMEEILIKLRLSGLANADPDIYRQMDTGLCSQDSVTSSVIPVSQNKGGALAKSSKTATTEEFGRVSEYVDQLIYDTGQAILGGEIGIKPYRDRKGTGCDYCPYQSVCGFDIKQNAYDFRDLEQLKEDELWKFIGARNKDR